MASPALKRTRGLPPYVGLLVAAGMLAVVLIGPMALGSGARAKGATRLSGRAGNRAPNQGHGTRISTKKKRLTTKTGPAPTAKSAPASMVVLGYNDLGMHCINQDFSQICILPPYNNLHAEIIDRSGEDPRIVTQGVQVKYSIPGNRSSANKTNFWNYAQALFGLKAPLAPNVGLTGNSLTGVMSPTTEGDWAATGIPVVPITDAGVFNPFQLALVQVYKNGKLAGQNTPVIPVSWEISCNLCHSPNDPSKVASDILAKHDAEFYYGVNPPRYARPLTQSTPVLCASCHADPALGTAGVSGVPTMSHSMHGAHANRFTNPAVMKAVNGNTCYACHPGMNTQCQRDVHVANNIHCTNCHGDMTAVANPARRPWVDLPHCTDCHNTPGHQYEEPGKLYKDSHGHNGVKCAACHGSPHAITPTVTAADNQEAINLQGFPGTISKCTVCHRQMPDDSFNHTLNDD